MRTRPRQGLTSSLRNAAVPEAFYRAAGFHVCGQRAVRIDMLERLADIIRPLTAWKPTEANTEPPPGAAGGGAFKVRPEMMSIMGCSGEELALILESLGFRREKRPVKKLAGEAPAPAAVNGAAEHANDNQTPSEQGAAAEPAEVQADEAAPADAPAEVAAEAHVDTEAPAPEEAVKESVEAAQAEPADEPAQEAASAEAAPAVNGEAAPAGEPEFEEVWRFRRPRPKFERPEGQGERRQHPRRDGREGQASGGGGGRERERGGQRPPQDRERRPREGAAPGGTAGGADRKPQEDRQKEHAAAGGNREHRPGGQRHEGGQHHGRDRDRQHKPGGERQGRPEHRAGQPNAQAPAKPEATGPRKAGSQQQGRGPQQQRRDRPERGGERERGREARPPRKQTFATAAPNKSSGSVDPDSPFAALSQLKERMEKRQTPARDEAV